MRIYKSVLSMAYISETICLTFASEEVQKHRGKKIKDKQNKQKSFLCNKLRTRAEP